MHLKVIILMIASFKAAQTYDHVLSFNEYLTSIISLLTLINNFRRLHRFRNIGRMHRANVRDS